MTTSDASWSARFRRIGDLERPDHHYLTEADDCHYLGDYTARAGWSHSATNRMISNLKKSPLKRDQPEWRYKGMAINQVAQAMRSGINPDRLADLTFVPIPPSKLSDHPEYDDRVLQIALRISPQGTRELIRAGVSRVARHIDDARHDPDALRETLILDRSLLEPRPQQIFLIDDVITTGCSFMVCKQMLAEEFPDTRITGLFVARRVLPSPFAAFAAIE